MTVACRQSLLKRLTVTVCHPTSCTSLSNSQYPSYQGSMSEIEKRKQSKNNQPTMKFSKEKTVAIDILPKV
jgi:hypothetical protein